MRTRTPRAGAAGLAHWVLLAACLGLLVACGGSGNGGSSTVGGVQQVTILPQSPAAIQGQTLQLSAIARDSSGNASDVTGQVSWSSSNAAVATVSASGLVTAVSDGSATISAGLTGASSTVQLEVTAGGTVPAGALYVLDKRSAAGNETGAVYQFRIGSDGALTPLSPPTVATELDPVSLVSDPSGKHVYVLNQLGNGTSGSASISQYAVDSAGALQALATPLTVSSASGGDLISLGGWLSVAPGGGQLYLVASSGGAPPSSSSSSSSSSGNAAVPVSQYTSILVYTLQSDGTLTPLAAAPLTLPAAPYGPLAFDPTGSYAYLPTKGAEVFAVDADGALTPAGAVATDAEVTDIAITPDGSLAYLLTPGLPPYSIGADGTLSPTGVTDSLGTQSSPAAVVFAANGMPAYVMTNTPGTFQGVSTELGSLAAYSYGMDGQLCSDCEAVLQVPPAVGVSLNLYSQALYAMVAYPWLDPAATPGGAIYFYANSASGGAPVITSIPSGLLMGMAAVITH